MSQKIRLPIERTMPKVIIGIPVLFVGGTEMHSFYLAETLARAGFDTKVCCYYDYDPRMLEWFKDAGIDVHLMRLQRIHGLAHLIKHLKKMFEAETPDFVHIQYIAPALAAIVAAKLARSPRVFATIHQPSTPYGQKERAFMKLASLFADVVMCNSLSVEKSWFGSSAVWNPRNVTRRRKHFTIYNSVAVDKISEIARKSESAVKDLGKELGVARKKVVGFVGRLSSEKGAMNLIQAMHHVVKIIPEARLLVVGDGPDKNILEQRAKSLELENKIQFLGAKSQEEVFRLYKSMDVLAVPSLFEGFGLTAAEAMAAGLPVVASNVDGLAEVVVDGVTGCLVPPNNPNALAEKLIVLLTDADLCRRMGQAGFDRVKVNFSMERFRESMLSVYEYFEKKTKNKWIP